MKRVSIFLIIFALLSMICITDVSALSPPYLGLNTSEDFINDNNAVLHATLHNIDNRTVLGFEFYLYKDGELIKNVFKETNSKESKISIVFDINKDLAIELQPNTEYKYKIIAKIDENISQDMYTQWFWFTTLKEHVTQQETTTYNEVQTTEKSTCDKCMETLKKPSKVKIKSIKNIRKKCILLKLSQAKNAKKYQVQYSQKKSFKKVITKITKSLKYKITKLKKGKTYYVRVRGINEYKKGRWSNIKRVVIRK